MHTFNLKRTGPKSWLRRSNLFVILLKFGETSESVWNETENVTCAINLNKERDPKTTKRRQFKVNVVLTRCFYHFSTRCFCLFCLSSNYACFVWSCFLQGRFPCKDNRYHFIHQTKHKFVLNTMAKIGKFLIIDFYQSRLRVTCIKYQLTLWQFEAQNLAPSCSSL